jgi:hypothetical protein
MRKHCKRHQRYEHYCFRCQQADDPEISEWFLKEIALPLVKGDRRAALELAQAVLDRWRDESK